MQNHDVFLISIVSLSLSVITSLPSVRFKVTQLTTFFHAHPDRVSSTVDGDHMPEAAQTILNEIQTLSSPPTNGKSFLVVDVYGRGNTSTWGEAYKQQVFDGLKAFHEGSAKLNVAYVDMAAIWDGVLGPNPG